MQDENQAQPQEGISPEPEVVEETQNLEDESNGTQEPKTYSEEEFKAVLGRAKKAEQLAKSLQGSTKKVINNKPTNSIPQSQVDIIRLTKKVPEDLIDSLKKVAQVNGTNDLISSLDDPIFLGIQKEYEAKERSKQSNLGVGNSSTSPKKEVGFNTPGLSPAEHKKMWQEARK